MSVTRGWQFTLALKDVRILGALTNAVAGRASYTLTVRIVNYVRIYHLDLKLIIGTVLSKIQKPVSNTANMIVTQNNHFKALPNQPGNLGLRKHAYCTHFSLKTSHQAQQRSAQTRSRFYFTLRDQGNFFNFL